MCAGGGGENSTSGCSVTGIFSYVSDGGTAWISQESFDVDETDSGAGLKWKNVAGQLKADLSSIILLSEEGLQVKPPAQPATMFTRPLPPAPAPS